MRCPKGGKLKDEILGESQCEGGKSMKDFDLPSGKRLRSCGKLPLLMGISTLSVVILNSYGELQMFESRLASLFQEAMTYIDVPWQIGVLWSLDQ